MRIVNCTFNQLRIFELDMGDIFFCDNNFYIAGLLNMCDHVRKCYNLNLDITENIDKNIPVICWRKDNVTLTLDN